MKAIQPVRKAGLLPGVAACAFLFLATWPVALSAPEDSDPEFRGPVLERPLFLNIPRDILHLIQAADVATVVMRIDTDGAVVDWIGLDVPHRGLVGALDRALRSAEFLPALVDGEAVPVDAVARVPVGEAARFTVLSVSISEHIESRIAALDPTMNQLSLSLPGQLDRPLQFLSRGEPFSVVDEESGETLSGTVLVEFYIDQDGRPRLIRTADGAPLALRNAAAAMVEEFRFVPPRRNGRPTVVKARIPVVFN
jgi:TonB family protein